MSLRAIKKRETLQNPNTGRSSVFKKSTKAPHTSTHTSAAVTTTTGVVSVAVSTFSALQSSVQQQGSLSGRKTRSSPELSTARSSVTLERLATQHARLVRTKSEADVSALLKSCTGDVAYTAGRGLIGAKSEVCLQTISSHSCYPHHQDIVTTHSLSATTSPAKRQLKAQVGGNMLSGARSHQSLVSPVRRRLSECSLNSSAGYSMRTSAMSVSALTLSSGTTGDPNTVLRVPIIGYEVMEERARFTVYKLRVENPLSNDCWLVLRRYTDFVRLNAKLKQAFPHLTLLLPRKKIFGDNFNAVFLDNRVQGLQMFVNSIMSKEELRRCKMVREFFCLDEPPSYSESMEECRAIFEAQEETISHLKVQINHKNDLILSLQQKLRDELSEKERLKDDLSRLTLCTNCLPPAANGDAAFLKKSIDRC